MPPLGAIKLEGGREMAIRLDRLDKKIRRRIIAKAIRAAGKPIIKDAKAEARKTKDTGLLAASIGARVKTYRGQNAFMAIGPRKGFKSAVRDKATGKAALRNPVKYAHLVEFGTKPHTITGSPLLVIGDTHVRTVQHPGSPPHPFLRPAFERHKHGAFKIMANVIRSGLKEFAGR